MPPSPLVSPPPCLPASLSPRLLVSLFTVSLAAATFPALPRAARSPSPAHTPVPHLHQPPAAAARRDSYRRAPQTPAETTAARQTPRAKSRRTCRSQCSPAAPPGRPPAVLPPALERREPAADDT